MCVFREALSVCVCASSPFGFESGMWDSIVLASGDFLSFYFRFKLLSQGPWRIISIFHWCMVWTEKSVSRVTDRHHEACRVLPNSDPE